MSRDPVFRVTLPRVGFPVILVILIQCGTWASLAEEEEGGNLFRVGYSSEGEPAAEVYRPPNDGDWFHVRKERQEERVPRGEPGGTEFEGRRDTVSKFANSPQRRDTEGHLGDFPEEPEGEYFPEDSVRERRRYQPPDYTRTEEGRPYEDGAATGKPCQCDFSYALKYKGVGGAARPGTYHVKVFHEETGEFKEDQGAKPVRNPVYPGGWGSGGQQRFYSSQQQQQQRTPQKDYYTTYSRGNYGSSQSREQPQSGRYYVEEVIDDGGDRRDIFQAGRGAGLKSTGVPNRMGSGGDGRGMGLSYKARNIRRTASSSIRKLVKTARAVVRHSNWATLAVMSSRNSVFDGYPYTQLCRVADGAPSGGNSTGIPYIFLMPDVIDVASYVDANLEIARVSLTLSLSLPPGSQGGGGGSNSEEEDFCVSTRGKTVDHWTCATVTLSGIIVPVTSTPEIDLATDSLTSRHSPQYLNPDGYFGKLIVKNVAVQSSSGGALHPIAVEDYL